MYNTKFTGSFVISPPLSTKQIYSLRKFNSLVHGDGINSYIVPNSQECHWVVSEDGQFLIWDGKDNFIGYVHWLHHLNKIFFIPWQKSLHGLVSWKGDHTEDRGYIIAEPTVREFDGFISSRITPPEPLYDHKKFNLKEIIITSTYPIRKRDACTSPKALPEVPTNVDNMLKSQNSQNSENPQYNDEKDLPDIGDVRDTKILSVKPVHILDQLFFEEMEKAVEEENNSDFTDYAEEYVLDKSERSSCLISL